jgi:hypothetical protein
MKRNGTANGRVQQAPRSPSSSEITDSILIRKFFVFARTIIFIMDHIRRYSMATLSRAISIR